MSVLLFVELRRLGPQRVIQHGVTRPVRGRVALQQSGWSLPEWARFAATPALKPIYFLSPRE